MRFEIDSRWCRAFDLRRFFLILIFASFPCVPLMLVRCACASDPDVVDYGHGDESDEWTKYYEPGLCGPIALYAICKYYKVSTTIDELAELSKFAGSGVSIEGLVGAAKTMQLQPVPLNSTIRHLKRQTGPAIIDFPSGHFCIFLGWNGKNARILDPPRPIQDVPVSELEQHWGKHLILFSAPQPLAGESFP
jgi:hypothetical protein